MSEANRLGPRLHPQRLGAALNQRVLLCIVEDPDFVATRATVLALWATRVVIECLIGTPLRNHEASLPSKLNQACVDGEPYNTAGPSFATGGKRSHDELTKCKCFLFVIGFHDMSLGQATDRALWGVYPIRVSADPFRTPPPRAILRAVVLWPSPPNPPHPQGPFGLRGAFGGERAKPLVWVEATPRRLVWRRRPRRQFLGSQANRDWEKMRPAAAHSPFRRRGVAATRTLRN